MLHSTTNCLYSPGKFSVSSFGCLCGGWWSAWYGCHAECRRARL